MLVAGMFDIDQQTGAVYAAVPLTHLLQSSYELWIIARDSLLPYRETLCRIVIVVLSAEVSNSPQFSVPPTEGATYFITEVRASRRLEGDNYHYL